MRTKGSISSVLSQDEIEQRQTVHRHALDLAPNNPVPFLVTPYSMWYATEDRLDNMDADLEEQQGRCEQQSKVPDYSIPHLKPGTGLGTIPAAFGCDWRPVSDADPWMEAVITAENPEAVYDLEIPDVSSDGMNPLFFQRLAYFEEHSSLPLECCNIPAPLTAASMIWKYSSFALALLEYPNEVHHLLELVTEYTIRFLRYQMKVLQRLWSFSHMNWYIPVDYGLRVSDDVMAILSPKHYEEFGVPYNSRLAREFDGIVVHSCGDIVHSIPSIFKIDGLRGIDLTLPHNDIQEIRDLVAGRMALMLRCWNQDWEGQSPPSDLVAYIADVLETLGTRGVMLEMQVPSESFAEAATVAGQLRAADWRS